MTTQREIERQLERKINQRYKKLHKDSQELIDGFTDEFEETDKKQKEKLSEEEYKKWRKKVVILSVVAGTLIKKLSKLATKANEDSTREIYISMAEAYTIGFNEWAKEFKVKYALNMSLADRKAIETTLRGNRLLPKPRINIPKDLKWNERRMRSALLQSLIKGESMPQLSKRLQNAVDMNRTSSIRNARTMAMHSYNAGQYEAGLEAIDKGIKMEKKWIAHIDNRTRQSHVEINGETVPYDEPFSNGLMFPLDFDGDPAEVYNCRCKLGKVVK